MAKSLVSLTVDDSSFNAKLKKAADSMKQFGQQLVNAAQAQTKLNAVMKANLYAMAATAAVEIGTALYKWASGAYEAEAAQKKLNAEIQQTKLAIDNMVNDLDFDTRIAQAAGKSVDEILKIRKAAAQARLDLADQNYDRVTALGSKATAEQIAEATKMQKDAWANMKKVMDDATINDVQRRNGTGPYRQRSGGGGSSASIPTYAADSIAAQEAEVSRLTKLWKEAGAAVRDEYLAELNSAKAVLDTMKGGGSNKLGKMGEIQSGLNIGNVLGGRLQLPEKLDLKVKIPEKMSGTEQLKTVASGIGQMTGGISSVVSGIDQLGIDIPDGLQDVVNTLGGISTIISGIASTVTAIGFLSALPWANGGIVHAAGGSYVPGHSYSGDLVPAMLNSGELVLNRAQQGNLASQLSGGIGNLNLTAEVDAEKIIFAVNNRGKRTGRGEMVTSKSRRHGA